MVDLHMHILPGLDDGASSMEESIRMARQAAAGGVNYIAASSHGNYYDCTGVCKKVSFASERVESAADSGKNFPIYGDFYERKGNATDPGSGASFY